MIKLVDLDEAHNQLWDGRPITLSCAQKVCLSGDYGDMRSGGGSTFTASIRNRPKLRMRVKSSGPAVIYLDGVPFPTLKPWPLVERFIAQLGRRRASFEFDIRPTNLRNVGLGSSGAASVLFAVALAIIDGRTLTMQELIHHAHGFETDIADLACGPQDHAAAVYGGLNVIDFPSLSARRAAHQSLWGSLSFWTTGERRDAHEIIPDVAGRHTEAMWALKEDLLEQIVAAFETGDVQALVSCFAQESRVQGELKMLTPRQAAVIQALEPVGAGAKVSGAGGGGVLVVAAFDEASAGRSAVDILREHQLRELRLSVDEVGLLIETDQHSSE